MKITVNDHAIECDGAIVVYVNNNKDDKGYYLGLHMENVWMSQAEACIEAIRAEIKAILRKEPATEGNIREVMNIAGVV